MNKILFFIAMSFMFFACKDKEPEETTTQAEEKKEPEGEWIALFDGVSAEGWRGFNQEGGLPDGWQVVDSTLMSLGKGGDIGGDIVYAADTFAEFELSLEWKLSAQGNSGIFYHVVEGPEIESPYFVAPEYQIIDQLNFPEKLEPWQSIGADYAMYDPVYTESQIRHIGEWNTSVIRFTKDKVTYVLNGNITVEFVPWSEDWEKRKAEGKWKDFPMYGTAKSGFIGLQDHGSPIWFRDIRIKKLM